MLRRWIEDEVDGTLKNSDALNDVFDRFVDGVSVFKDREVLRHDYLPDRLPHREEQIRKLGETVAPVLKGARCSNVFIYGQTGTGKTAVAKYVLCHLEAKAKELGAAVKFGYVNCRIAGSDYRVLANLSQNVGVSVPFTGLSTGEVFDRLREGIESSKVIYIAVLDEADALAKPRGDSLLYELTRVNETLRYSKVALIGISNDLRLKEFLDPRVLSSLSEEEIVFRPYDAAELKNILSERASAGFRENNLSDSALGLCAALAAAEHGDARRALDLLRVAGEVAERKGIDVVTEEHVREAEKHIEHNRVIEALQNLTLHSKLVVLGVYRICGRNAQGASTGEIFGVYTGLCVELGITPLTQRRLSALVNELDVMGIATAKIVSMGRYGRTKKIRLGIMRNVVREVFGPDARLGRFIGTESRCVDHSSSGS